MQSPLIRSICTLVLVCLLGGLVPPFDPVTAAPTAGPPRTLSLNQSLPTPNSIPSLAPAVSPIDEAALEQHHIPVAAPVEPVANVAWESETTTFNSPPTWWSLPHVVLGPEENLHAVFVDTSTVEGGLYYTAGELSETVPRALVAEGLPTDRDGLYPRIAVDDGGGIHVLWFMIQGYNSAYLHYRYCPEACLNEDNWQESYLFPNQSVGGVCPDNPSNPAIVAWGSGDTRQIVIAIQGGNDVWTFGCTNDNCNNAGTQYDTFYSRFSAGVTPALALGPSDDPNEPRVHLLYPELHGRWAYASYDDDWVRNVFLAHKPNAFLVTAKGAEKYAVQQYGLAVDEDGVISVGWMELVGNTSMPFYRRCKGACDTPEQWSDTALIGNRTTAPALPTPLITSTNPVTQTATDDGYVGMRIHTNDMPLQLGGLGRYTDEGDETHDLRVVRASDGQTLSQTSLDLTTATVGADGLAYANLPQPIVLAPNTSYDIITSVTAGGDPYYRADVTSLESVQVTGTVEGAAPDTLTFTEAPGEALGPVSLLFASASDGTPINSPVPHGLYGHYFAGIDFNRPIYARNDSTIDFAWDASPAPGIVPADNFSVRWRGFVRTNETGDYTFGLNVAGGVRVWFGDELVVDEWDDGSERTVTWQQYSEPEHYWSIQIEYQAVSGAEAAALTWQAPSATEATPIPNRDLLPNRLDAISVSRDVRLVTTPDQHLGALWRQLDPPDDPDRVSLRWSVLTHHTHTWSKPVALMQRGYAPPSHINQLPLGDFRNPDVSIASDGVVHFTWTRLTPNAYDEYLQGQYVLSSVGIPGDQAYAHEACGEVAVASKCVRAFQGDPVDTFSGNFSHQHTDITIPTAGEPLELIRAYNSLATDQDGPFGFGWTHNYHARLILPGMPGGEDGVMILAMPFGSQLRFAIQEDGSYQPFPGIYSQLTSSDDGGFVLTGRDQQVWRFDLAGRVIEQSDTNGQTIFLNYYGTPTTGRACPSEGASAGQLCTVVDASGLRYLDFRYASDRVDTVRDPLDRTISYTYSAGGNITRADISDSGSEEMLERYEYFGTSRNLYFVRQPGVVLVENFYDSTGRVTRQVINELTEALYKYELTADGRRTTVTQNGADGTRDVIVDTYRADGTLKKQERNGRLVKYVTFDESLGLSSTTNANGQTTLIESNAVGQPTRITNDLEQVTEMTYDSRNRLTTITDPLSRAMRLTYDEKNMVRQIEQGIVDGAEAAATTTITTDVRYPNRNLVEEIEDATGMVTHFTYNEAGDVTEIAQGYGTPDVTLTQREYDAVGRLIRETLAAETDIARTTALEYHPNDTVVKMIENYADGVFDEAITDEDLPTTYDYQGQRLTRETYPDGTATVTDYDSGGRIEFVIFDGDPDRGGGFNPAYPDDNIGVYYAYDGLGRVESIRETGLLTGTFDTRYPRQFETAYARTTRYTYDDWSRVVTTTHNYQSDGPVDSSTNLQEVLRYDAFGNVIASRDALGRWTNTEYDTLNRPIKVTANVDDGDPTTGSSDTDLITTMRYDAGGRLDRTIELYVDGSFDPAEPDADRMTTYTYNTLDQLTRTITNRDDGDPTTGSSDTDLITTYEYDALGRPIETVDPLERRQVQQYDTLGRLRASIANYQNGQHDGDDAPDTDLVTTYTYNALSQISRVTDVTGLVTAYRYDGMGRLSTEIRNYDAEGSTDHQTNLTTRYAYNTQGALTSETSPAGVETTYRLDKLGRPTQISRDSSYTRFGYDGLGTLRWIQPGGRE